MITFKRATSLYGTPILLNGQHIGNIRKHEGRTYMLHFNQMAPDGLLKCNGKIRAYRDTLKETKAWVRRIWDSIEQGEQHD